MDKSHCEKAVDTVANLRKNYHKLVATVGFSQNDVRQAAKDIYTLLFNNPTRPISREEIMRSLFGRIDSDTMDRAIATLDQTGFITVSGTNVPLYSLSTKGKELVLGELKVTGKAQ